jgi:hypothetical protein
MISFLVSVTAAVQLAGFSDEYKDLCLQNSRKYECIFERPIYALDEAPEYSVED